ncbi:MAG TPA: hypothetical protein VMV04_08785 [Thermodesulfobacteriota bacterium]|nr:hypothetical protein [Thermodesulfobacteriota bacterium]
MSKEKKGAILVGDIGGTNTRLAIIEIVKGHFNFLAEETFPSREVPNERFYGQRANDVLLQAIPVRVILNPRVAILGAARCAMRQ